MLAWHPELVRPYESAWALLQRFMVLNQPTIKELHQLVGRPDIRYTSFCLQSNFTTKKAYSEEKFKFLFGVDSRGYERLFPDFFGLSVFTSSLDTLRYCPDCMRIGYHSAAQQAPALRLCPIHGKAIVDRCKICKESIPFNLSRPARENLYACPNGHPLMPADDVTRLLAPLDQHHVDRVDRFLHTARVVANDERRKFWIFDAKLHSRADRRAYWLFAKAIGMDEGFVQLFHGGSLIRSATMGQPHIPLPDRYVDPNDRDEVYFARILTERARRWLGHIAHPAIPYQNDEFSVSMGWCEREHRHKRAWGMPVAGTEGDTREWMEFWGLDPYPPYTYWTSGAVGGVILATAGIHFFGLRRTYHPELTYPLTERQFRWVYRKMLVWLFVATYKLTLKLNRWSKLFPSHPDRPMLQMGAWSYPRFYLLADRDQTTVFLVDSDHACPEYRLAVVNERNRAARAGGRRFLAFLDGEKPPKVPPKRKQPVAFAKALDRQMDEVYSKWVYDVLGDDLPSR